MWDAWWLYISSRQKLSKSLIGHGDQHLGKTFDRRKAHADAKAAQHALGKSPRKSQFLIIPDSFPVSIVLLYDARNAYTYLIAASQSFLCYISSPGLQWLPLFYSALQCEHASRLRPAPLELQHSHDHRMHQGEWWAFSIYRVQVGLPSVHVNLHDLGGRYIPALSALARFYASKCKLQTPDRKTGRIS